MASLFSELSIDSAQPRAIAEWWAEVLGYEIASSTDEYIEIKSASGSLPTLGFAKVPDPKSVKNRLHIDLSPTDRDQGEELERLLSLGARRIDVGQGEDVSWVVLADPEGNEFCLLRTRIE
jgi:hypothetical protein